MYGYIRPCKPELKMKEFSVYKAVYCGLCRTLGRRYGLFARFLLSYDATFFCLLELSGQDACPGFGKTRCPANPLRRCDAASESPAMDFWADVSALLFAEKLEDDRRDAEISHRFAAALLRPYAAWLRRKAARRNPEAAKLVTGFSSRQAQAERERGGSLDAAAHPTADLMARLLDGRAQGETARVLERLGYFLGRFIYLADAADDFAGDLRRGDYNPFAAALGLSAASDRKARGEAMRPVLNVCIREAAAAFALLTCKRFAAIPANVLELGLPRVEQAVLSGLDKKRRLLAFADVYRL